MDSSLLSGVTAAATVVLAVFTAALFLETRRYVDVTNRQLQQTRQLEAARALRELMAAYGSPEMMTAVSMLWSLYGGCGGDTAEMVTHYWDSYKRQQKIVERATGRHVEMDQDLVHSLELLDRGLDQQRRLVSAFYRQLDMLVEKGILTKKDADNHWSQSDRRILSDIIWPIEKGLGELSSER
jgi:hypothetical protein